MPEQFYLGDDNDLGDEELMGDEELLGAIRRRGRRRRAQAQAGQPAMPTPTRKPALPYSARPSSKLRSYMGMGVVSWTGADAADKVLIVEPQEAFRGERLIIDVVDSAAAQGILLLRRLDVGSLPQSPSVEAPMPASSFRADSTYSGLDLQVAKAGVKISCQLGVTAAPGGVVVRTATAGLFGEWIR